MRHLDLFSGMGGFALAAEEVWDTVEHTFVEYDPFCQSVLRKHWPDAAIHGDIRRFVADSRSGEPRGIPNKRRKEVASSRDYHLLTGGFPCQPFSVAGQKKGTGDDRYLWPPMLESVALFRPRWVIAENVPGLVAWNDGLVLEVVCSDLEKEGYEVCPFIIPASSVGAPHRRDRIWIIAHRRSERRQQEPGGPSRDEGTHERRSESDDNELIGRRESDDTDSPDERCLGRVNAPGLKDGGRGGHPFSASRDNSHASDDTGKRRGQRNEKPGRAQERARAAGEGRGSPDGARVSSDSKGRGRGIRPPKNKRTSSSQIDASRDTPRLPAGWAEEWPSAAARLCVVDDGLPRGLDKRLRAKIYKAAKHFGREETERLLGGNISLERVDPWRAESLKAAGNAIVPQVAVQIMLAIKRAEDTV